MDFITWLLGSFLFVQSCSGYNLESRLPLFKYGPPGSTFGFSVQMHKSTTDPDAELREVYLVAGAPTAVATPEQPSTTRPGGVFYCPVTTNTNDCSRVSMDAGGDVTESGIKSNQWLGVSLKSQGPGKKLMSCAHRWMKQIGTGTEEKEMICGKCFLLNSTTDGRIVEIPAEENGFISSPCELLANLNKDLGSKFTLGYIQSGTSISFSPNHYTLGAPGAWQWTGALYDISMPNFKADNSFAALTGSPSLYYTPECTKSSFHKPYPVQCDKIPLGRDSYMGFSLAQSNRIGKDSDILYYAAGAPRGNYTGVVAFFTQQRNDIGDVVLMPALEETVAGEGISSSFGYSIALTDVNNDDLDDLIVGAPQYYQYLNSGKYGGAVYVYINHPDRGFRWVKPQVFYGPLDSYFGHSIAALGDVDQDGFNDFAVGAPYENENGTVHIFRGSASGKVVDAQTIQGSDYNFVPSDGQGVLTGFGASVAGVVDADSNKYPDLFVGTLSDHVALIRARPIIAINMTFEASPLSLDLTESCPGGNQACFTIKFCFKYKTRHNEYSEKVPIKYKLILDSERQENGKTSRVHVLNSEGTETAVLEEKYKLKRAGKFFCPENGFTAYFNDKAKDKLAPIGVKFEFDLDNAEVKRENSGDAIFPMIQDPILDADYERQASSTIVIGNNCGDDGCQSDLELSANMPDKVTVGLQNNIILSIDVSNNGEEAHQSVASIRIPSNVEFNNYTVPTNSNILCFPEQTTGQSIFISCVLGNPYKNGSKDSIELNLGISRLTARDKELTIEVSASTTSTNKEITPIFLKAKVIVEYTLSLTALGRPEQLRYKQEEILGESAMKQASDIGPLLEYTFTVKNDGFQSASDILVNVELPYEIFNGKWLLYLLSTEVTSGGGIVAGRCLSDHVNELRLTPPLQLSASRKGRQKRAAQDTSHLAQASSRGGSFQSIVNLDCSRNRANCIPVECTLDEIQPGTTLSIFFQVYLWQATFLEEYTDVDLVSIKTNAKLKAAEENIVIKGDKTSAKIETTVDHELFDGEINAAFPWWYILIGVLLTLIIYILILVLLIKCGFFKRKKIPRQEEVEDEDDGKLVEERTGKRDRNESAM